MEIFVLLYRNYFNLGNAPIVNIYAMLQMFLKNCTEICAKYRFAIEFPTGIVVRFPVDYGFACRPGRVCIRC